MKIFQNKFFLVCICIALVLTIVPSVFSIMGYKGLAKNIVGTITMPVRWCITSIANGFEGWAMYFRSMDALNEQNEALKEDDLFSVMFCVGGLVKGENGEKVIENVVTPRTASANGLTLNGGNAIVEDLRDIIMRIVRNAHAGAIVNRIRREENDISHFPLEWAVFYVEYLEPESLTEGLV
jgi:hypothetical protein